jgi:hypothetical protein
LGCGSGGVNVEEKSTGTSAVVFGGETVGAARRLFLLGA